MPVASEMDDWMGRLRNLSLPSLNGSPILLRVVALAPAIPALMLAFPFLLWPLTEGQNLIIEDNFVQAPPSSEPGLVNRIYFPLMFLWALLAFFALPRERLQLLFSACVIAVLALMVFSAASFLWSLEPTLVLRRSLQQSIIIGAILLPALSAKEPEDLLHPLFALCAIVVLINLYSVFTSPPGPLGGHEGIYPQKNYLGAVMGICIVTAFAYAASQTGALRWGAIVVALLAFVILVMSRAKTSIALGLVVPVLAAALHSSARYLRISPALLMPTIVFACYAIYQIGVQSYLWDYEIVATTLFGDATISGRTLIWSFAIDMIAEKPLLGWGYETFWFYSFDAPSVREGPSYVATMPHAHNGYLDQLLHTGVIGFCLLGLVLIVALSTAYRLAGRSALASHYVLAAIAFSIGYNLFETAWFFGWNMVSMAFVLAVGLLARFGSART